MMIFGILKDVKAWEYRVTCTPAEASMIIRDGHSVIVQKDAGLLAGFDDEAYKAIGAEIVETTEEMYAKCDFLAKVKEIEESEYKYLRENQIIFTCIHPAAHPEEVDALLASKCISFTAEDAHRYGSVNCEAAGKQGALFGLNAMLTTNGGKGKFPSGLAGSPGINALVLGGGLVGRSALEVLYALGANCTVMDINVGTLRDIQRAYHEKVNTQYSSKENIKKLLPNIDLVINSVKWPKGSTDYLIDRPMLKLMEKGSVIVDISNDTPGAIESFRETTHDDPTYVEDGIIHYGVSNIPSSIARSVSEALSASVIHHFRNILNKGVETACINDGFLRRSMTTYKGYLTHEETSAIQNKPWVRPETILKIENEKLDFAPAATVSKSNNFIEI